MNLIVSAAIVLLNPYVTVYISYKIPPFALSVHIPDVSTSIVSIQQTPYFPL